MIFRRIKAHVEKENWFAVFVDFCIVVIGVFIGIQVANWNEVRGEQQRAELLKERLVAEFTRIESYIADNIDQLEDWKSVSDRVSRKILTGELTDPHNEKLNEVTAWIQPPGTSATYNEIVSQGDMDLLTSPLLRAALIDYKILAERHLDANLVLIESIQKDRDLIHRISSLALVAVDDRPESYTDALQSELESPDLYVGISNIARARRLDHAWHRGALEGACAVLEALEQPCAHADEPQEQEQNP